MKTKIVDIHPHIVSTETVKYPLAPLEGKQSEWSKKRSVNFEEMVAVMDEADVGKAVLVHSSTTHGYDCSYLADSVAKLPQRLTVCFPST